MASSVVVGVVGFQSSKKNAPMSFSLHSVSIIGAVPENLHLPKIFSINNSGAEFGSNVTTDILLFDGALGLDRFRKSVSEMSPARSVVLSQDGTKDGSFYEAGANIVVPHNGAETTLNPAMNRLATDLMDNKKSRRLQHELMQERHVALPGATISLLLRPKTFAGGDLVGTFPISENERGFCAFDVSGHGISSALLIARLASLIAAHGAEKNPSRLKSRSGENVQTSAAGVTVINDLLINEIESDHFLTCLIGSLNYDTGRLNYCQAGHPAPIVFSEHGHRVLASDNANLPVGLVPGARYQNVEYQMAPGERFLVCSDGIIECTHPHNGEQLGPNGLAEIIQSNKKLGDQILLEMLVWELARYQGSDEFEDDLSAVLLTYDPQDKK